MRTHSVVTSAVIASLLLFNACAIPVQQPAVPKVEVASSVSTPITPAGKAIEVQGNTKAELTTNSLAVNGTTVNGTGVIPPQDHDTTTSSPITTTTNKSTTPIPITTIKPSPTPPHNTTAAPTTTPATPPTTAAPITKPTVSTTVKPASTTAPSKPTAAPTAAPHNNDRKFDGPSFIGGIILACGLSAIGFVAFKFYKARTEHNYHTL